MFTVRAARIASVASDMVACSIIWILAQREKHWNIGGRKRGAGVGTATLK
jgi:hypothetical protein